MQIDAASLVRPMHLPEVGKRHALASGIDAFPSHVVEPKHDILCRHYDGLAARRGKNVVGGHHERAGFELCLQGERHVDGHLIAVEVGVVRRTNQRMKLNGLPFNQHRLERLDTEPMQGRCPIQQDRMLADHFGEYVPDFRCFALDHLLCGLDGCGESARF